MTAHYRYLTADTTASALRAKQLTAVQQAMDLLHIGSETQYQIFQVNISTRRVYEHSIKKNTSFSSKFLRLLIIITSFFFFFIDIAKLNIMFFLKYLMSLCVDFGQYFAPWKHFVWI